MHLSRRSFLLTTAAAAAPGKKLRVLVVDGINNHDWQAGTREIRRILEATGRFTIAVSTSPPKDAPRADWDAYVTEQNARLDGFSREGRLMQRYLFGGAQPGELDRQGRVALPAPLLQHAQLGKDIVIAGLQDRLEIWDREAWRRQLAEVEGSAESVAERLAQPKP